MTSASAYYSYKDLVQTYSVGDLPYVPSPPHRYHAKSVMGWIAVQPRFTIFTYLLQMCGLDILLDQPQFQSTLFVCPDEYLRSQLGESFFMNLDRNSALSIVNLNILTRPIHPSTFVDQPLSILTTRDPIEKSTAFYQQGAMTIQGSGNSSPLSVSGAVFLENGIVYILTGLLLPNEFQPSSKKKTHYQ